MNNMILQSIDADLDDYLYKWFIEYPLMCETSYLKYADKIKNHIVSQLNEYVSEIEADGEEENE